MHPDTLKCQWLINQTIANAVSARNIFYKKSSGSSFYTNFVPWHTVHEENLALLEYAKHK